MLLGGACCGAARCVTRWRAPRELFVSGRAVLKSKRVCVRACRAAGLALWAGRKIGVLTQVNERETLQELNSSVLWMAAKAHARVIDTRRSVDADAGLNGLESSRRGQRGLHVDFLQPDMGPLESLLWALQPRQAI